MTAWVALAAACLAAAPPGASAAPPGASAAPPGASTDVAAAPPVLERLYRSASPALVQIDRDPRWAGAVLSADGIIVTAAQGLAGRAQVPVTFANGFASTAQVLAVDHALGLAWLQARGLPRMASLALSPTPAGPVDPVYALGWRDAQTSSVSFARVLSTEVLRAGEVDPRFLTARFGLAPATRGQPLLSYAGQVVGVALAHDARGTAFALSSRAILANLAAHAAQLPPRALAVSSTPPGAEVWLDGKEVGAAPLTVSKVAPGEHLLALRSPGMPDVLRRVVLLGAPQVSLALPVMPGAAVQVEAPAGARVYADGLLRAVGPAALYLPSGSHRIQVLGAQGAAFSRQVEVVEDRPLQLPVSLAPPVATLSVDTVPPGAEVALDGRPLGVTPLRGARVAPGGDRLLRLTRPGFHTVERHLALARDAQVNLGQLRLGPPRGRLVIHAPPGTQVSIDGAPRQPVSPTQPVPAGAHRAVLYAPYQYAAVAPFRVADGQEVVVAPTFVAAGAPAHGEVLHVLSNALEGAGGVAALVSAGLFLSAEADRSSNGTLSANGHGQVRSGLITAGLGLGLYAAGALLDALRPTPEMGHDRTAQGTSVSAAPHP